MTATLLTLDGTDRRRAVAALTVPWLRRLVDDLSWHQSEAADLLAIADEELALAGRKHQGRLLMDMEEYQSARAAETHLRITTGRLRLAHRRLSDATTAAAGAPEVGIGSIDGAENVTVWFDFRCEEGLYDDYAPDRYLVMVEGPAGSTCIEVVDADEFPLAPGHYAEITGEFDLHTLTWQEDEHTNLSALPSPAEVLDAIAPMLPAILAAAHGTLAATTPAPALAAAGTI